MKYIIFDFDGTIADSFPLLVSSLDEASEKFRLQRLREINVEEFRDYEIREIFSKLKIPFWILPFVVRFARRKMRTEIENINLISGIKEVILELSKDFNLFILSSNSNRNIASMLEREGILNNFKSFRGGVSFFGKKRALKRFMKINRLDLNETMYVTDEVRDVKATRSIGLRHVAVSWGYNSEKALRAKNPDNLINEPKELSKLILKLKSAKAEKEE